MAEKEAFRELLKERARARDAPLVGPDRTTEAPAGNEEDVVEGGVVEGGVVEGGANRDLVIISGAKPAPKN